MILLILLLSSTIHLSPNDFDFTNLVMIPLVSRARICEGILIHLFDTQVIQVSSYAGLLLLTSSLWLLYLLCALLLFN